MTSLLPPGPPDGAASGALSGERPHCLVYRSRSNLPVAPEDAVRDIAAILQVSRHLNLLHDITGVLIYAAGHFAQVLEGPTAAVETCFGRIRQDPRHLDVDLLQSAPATSRRFASWNMAYIDGASPSPVVLSRIAGLGPPSSLIRDTVHALRRLLPS